MYINDLGMRDDHAAENVGAAQQNSAAQYAGSTRTSAADKDRFPTTLQEAVEAMTADKSADPAETAKIEEALERLKSDPEWADVGTTLTALYTNQQKLQTQMNLLSSGYYGGLNGLGLGALLPDGNASLLSAYTGMTGLGGSSIFGDLLL